jgi:hypothetical protein
LAVLVALYVSGKDSRWRKRAEHYAQAQLVSVWYSGEGENHSEMTINNSSEQPIYEVVATLTINQRPSEGLPRDTRAVVPTLPPGRWIVDVAAGWAGTSAYPTAEIAFTDHRGNKHWLRRSDGRLEEMDEPAIEHFEIGRPFGHAQIRAG